MLKVFLPFFVREFDTIQPGQVVIGESTRALLPDNAAVESLGELAVKGRRSGVVAYRLFGLHRANV